MEPEDTSSTQSQAPQQEPVQPVEKIVSKKPFNKKVFIIVGILLVVIVFLAIFILFRNRENQINQTPAGKKATSLQEDVILATVGEEDITVMDLNHFAASNLGEKRLDSDTLKGMLDVLIERAILDQEVALAGLNITPDNGLRNEAYYAKVREQVSQGKVSSVEVTKIAWWLPPLGEYEQTKLSIAQRGEQDAASTDIERMMTANVPILDILKEVSVTYPNIAQSISLNGSRYEGESNTLGLQLTEIHEYNEKLDYFPGYSEMFQMNEGDVIRNVWEDGSGAEIIKAIAVNRGEGISYENWLNQIIIEKVVFNEEVINSL